MPVWQEADAKNSATTNMSASTGSIDGPPRDPDRRYPPARPRPLGRPAHCVALDPSGEVVGAGPKEAAAGGTVVKQHYRQRRLPAGSERGLCAAHNNGQRQVLPRAQPVRAAGRRTLKRVTGPWRTPQLALTFGVAAQAAPAVLLAAVWRAFTPERSLPLSLNLVWLALPLLVFPLIARAVRRRPPVVAAFLLAAGVSLPALLAAASWALAGPTPWVGLLSLEAAAMYLLARRQSSG